jgi:hemerythrin
MKGNELIKWSYTFSCGIRVIDEQHKGLVELVNDLFNHVSGNDKEEREYFNKIIQEAVNYVKTHFATEERIMDATKFEGYLEHKHAHNVFILNIGKHIQEYKSGRRLSLLSFTKFLKEWVLSHIAVMDKQYFEHFRKIAVRKDDGSMKIQAAEEEILFTAPL